MPTPRRSARRRRFALVGALALTIASTPACAVHHSHGYAGSCNTNWYEDVGVALLAVGVFIIAVCSGGHYHGGYHSGYHGHYH